MNAGRAGLIFLIVLMTVGSASAGTLIKYVDSTDGYTARNSAAVYSTVRNGAGTTSNWVAATTYMGYLRGSTTASQYDRFYRGVLVFNTSSLPDDCNITYAELVVYVSAKTTALGSPDYVITGTTPTVPSVPATADHNKFTSTELCSRVSNANVVVGVLHLPLNAAGISYINKTGYTDLCLRDSWDVDNSFGGAWASAGVTAVTIVSNEGTSDPFLIIAYDDAEGADPEPGVTFNPNWSLSKENTTYIGTESAGLVPWPVWLLVVLSTISFFSISLITNKNAEVTAGIAVILSGVSAYTTNMIGFIEVQVSGINTSEIIIEPVITAQHPPWLSYVFLGFFFVSLINVFYQTWLKYLKPLGDEERYGR